MPVSGSCCGLPGALSVIVMAPERVPVAVGVNVTLSVQDFVGWTALPQLLVSAKSPDAAILVISSSAVPGLVSVTSCGALVVPCI